MSGRVSSVLGKKAVMMLMDGIKKEGEVGGYI